FCLLFFFFSSRRRHTRWPRDWSSDVCSSDLSKVLLSCGLLRTLVSQEAGLHDHVHARGRQRIPGDGHAVVLSSAGGRTGADLERSEERRVGKEGRRWRGREE